jgi:putative Mg2+ transporter-C (MgtC) family protein
MASPTVQFAQHLLVALLAGAVIGTERTFHGRAAGFRTHALVAMASAMLMLLTLSETRWVSPGDAVRMDPTRMAQGIMTGIGFLGAGVIFKEGINVRGLTTAASIWTTAAVGILMGVGLFAEGALATVLTVGVLSVFRSIEKLFPTQLFAEATLRLGPGSALSEGEVRELYARNGFVILNLAYKLDDRDRGLEYRMAIRTTSAANLARLAACLRTTEGISGFAVTPAGD